MGNRQFLSLQCCGCILSGCTTSENFPCSDRGRIVSCNIFKANALHSSLYRKWLRPLNLPSANKRCSTICGLVQTRLRNYKKYATNILGWYGDVLEALN